MLGSVIFSNHYTAGRWHIELIISGQSQLSGSSNLLCQYGLHDVYKCVSSVKRQLSAFLPNVPGNVDNPMQHTDSRLSISSFTNLTRDIC